MLHDITVRFLTMLIVFTPLELLFPRRKIAINRKHRLTDLLYIFVAVFPIAFHTLLITTLGTWILSPFELNNVQKWISELPIWTSLPLLILIVDVGYYWVHRAHHEIPALWRLHAIHHSIEELDWMAAHRVHPIDQALTRGISMVPVVWLGFDNAAILLWGTVFSFHSMLKHSNVNVRFGPLRWLLIEPAYHHWHHANQSEAFNKNYAGQLPILDLLFGTAFMKDESTLKRYGTGTKVPDSFIGQIVHPAGYLQEKYSKNEDHSNRGSP